MTDLLQDAIVAMAARDTDHAQERNHIGFNGSDTDYGNWLASNPSALKNLKQRKQAYKMLKKYRKQLTEYGIDYDKIPDPGTEPERVIRVKELLFQFFAPYNDQLVARWRQVRQTQSATWNSTEQCWEVPIEKGHELAMQMNEDFGFMFTPEAIEAWASA